MTFLELAQRLRQEMNDTGDGPFQVTEQKGRNLEYVNAIKDAWLDIQQIRQWSTHFWQNGFSPDKLQVLETSTEMPFIPTQYHLAIVFYAMQTKAISQNAQELILRGQAEWDKYLHFLCRDFLDDIQIG